MMVNSNWTRIPIKEAYEALFDGPHATPKPSNDGPIFLGIKNITEDGHLDFTDVRHISEEEFPIWTRRVTPQPGDIVFTYEATLNRYAIIPNGFRGCLGRRIALIRPNRLIVDNRFLYYYFFGDDWRKTIQQNILSGSTVDRIPLIEFPNFPISLPDLDSQRKIAAVLSAYDDLIENNTRRIAILEEMACRLYREWFVHFRFPGHEEVEMVEVEGFGRVPEGWEVRPLGEVIELVYGKGLVQTNRVKGPFPVYGSSGVVDYHNEALVEGPGIVVGRKGNVGSVFWSDTDFYPIDTTYYVQTRLPLHYVYYNLQDQHFMNAHAAVPGLSRQQAYLNSFLVPQLDTMNKFQEFVEPVFAQVHHLRRKNENLRQTRDLLLPRLISGELDVSKLDIMGVIEND